MLNSDRSPTRLRIGVDVGGTFTDLVCFDPDTGNISVIKVPSTPPDYQRAVIEAVGRAAGDRPADIIHGSTVATNALLQRKGEPIAFITTEGFGDMLLIGRQNRPNLYALNIQRPPPITPEENWFTVRERISATGEILEPLLEDEAQRVIETIRSRGLRHVAICLLFSFINPAHEQLLAKMCADAGLTASLSSDVLPEFREYERASTTAINASLRPIVRDYLEALETGLAHSSSPPAKEQPPLARRSLSVMHSAGGTLSVAEAQKAAARLVLSGPAGGVLGGAFVAKSAGFSDVITYDMGGTSTDVAVVLDGQPQWTTTSTIDGLPISLPMFDINTVGAGGGSIAWLDPGGALRVGPRSAGAVPGPACYALGGLEPTVTDANFVLGRILPDRFLGGAMQIDPSRARSVIAELAGKIGKTVIEAALGIIKVAEANMEQAIRAITSRRGHDPRAFALVSFGGAGGLHACALADALEIPTVLIPPYSGVLSALGMVVAPPVADASRTVVHLRDQLDDARLAAEYGLISGQTMEQIPYDQTAGVEAYADVRFRGQSHELKVRVDRPSIQRISELFREAYRHAYGQVPSARAIEIVTLRVRRIGRREGVSLPAIEVEQSAHGSVCMRLCDTSGVMQDAPAVTRSELLGANQMEGPLLIVDATATAFVPNGWNVQARKDGSIILGAARKT